MESKYWGTEVAYKNGYEAGLRDAKLSADDAKTDKDPWDGVSMEEKYPNNYCGECPVFLEGANSDELCAACPSRPLYVIHIPSGCCYPLEPDGKTVIICGAHLTPEIDGKVFWRYSRKYVEKVVVPTDPFANH